MAYKNEEQLIGLNEPSPTEYRFLAELKNDAIYPFNVNGLCLISTINEYTLGLRYPTKKIIIETKSAQGLLTLKIINNISTILYNEPIINNVITIDFSQCPLNSFVQGRINLYLPQDINQSTLNFSRLSNVILSLTETDIINLHQEYYNIFDHRCNMYKFVT